MWDRVDRVHVQLGYITLTLTLIFLTQKITNFTINKQPDFLPDNSSLSVVEEEGYFKILWHIWPLPKALSPQGLLQMYQINTRSS